jgi:ABC-type Fe3+ transport system permease subunit
MRGRIARLRDSGISLVGRGASARASIEGNYLGRISLANVLPGVVRRTMAPLTLLLVMGTARLVTMYRFPGRGLFQWLLLLPLALPTYIIAHCYLELFDYSACCKPDCASCSAGIARRTTGFPTSGASVALSS